MLPHHSLQATLAVALPLLLCLPASADELPRLDSWGGPDESGAPLAIVVHGIHPSPGELDPLTRDVAARGYRTFQFHYDDDQDLDRSATELALVVKQRLLMHAAPRLVVVAHSMGGLVARRALTRGQSVGLSELSIRIDLVTVASPFGGFRSANFARLDLGLGPGSYDDLGSRSRFIRQPGSLGANVRHLKVETFERGRTVVVAGKRVDDDRLKLRHERNPAVDREAASRHLLPLGHIEVVNSAGAVSLALALILDWTLGPKRRAPASTRQGVAQRLQRAR